MARNSNNTQALEKSAANQVQVRERQLEPQQQPRGPKFTPPVDIWETGQEWLLLADVPGADPESIDITCEEGTLTLYAPAPARWPYEATLRRAEYRIGGYHRSFRIGEDIDVDQISAEYIDGVLKIRLPRTPRARARKVPITTS